LIGTAERATDAPATARELVAELAATEAAEAKLSPAERVERIAGSLPAHEAMAAVEHRFGVMILVEEHLPASDARGRIAAGEALGALGLFTPEPETDGGAARDWPAAALIAERGSRSGEDFLLSGDLRLATADADGNLALVREAGEGGDRCRLAWLDLRQAEARGIERLSPAGEVPQRLTCHGTPVGADAVSAPIDPGSGGTLDRALAGYAELWGLAAVTVARQGVVALRRAARLAGYPSAQLVATAVTEVEIEAEVALAGVRLRLEESEPRETRDALARSWAAALAAGRALALTAETTRSLRDRFALETDGPFAGPSSAGLTTGLGGVTFLEHALARELGIGRPEEEAP